VSQNIVSKLQVANGIYKPIKILYKLQFAIFFQFFDQSPNLSSATELNCICSKGKMKQKTKQEKEINEYWTKWEISSKRFNRDSR
jgi:hypothetical protein